MEEADWRKLCIDEKATLQSVVRIETGWAWGGLMWLRIGTIGELMWIWQWASRFRNTLGIYFVHLHLCVQFDIVQRKWLLCATFEVLSGTFLNIHVFWNMKFCRWVCGSRGSRVKQSKKNECIYMRAADKLCREKLFSIFSGLDAAGCRIVDVKDEAKPAYEYSLDHWPSLHTKNSTALSTFLLDRWQWGQINAYKVVHKTDSRCSEIVCLSCWLAEWQPFNQQYRFSIRRCFGVYSDGVGRQCICGPADVCVGVCCVCGCLAGDQCSKEESHCWGLYRKSECLIG